MVRVRTAIKNPFISIWSPVSIPSCWAEEDDGVRIPTWSNVFVSLYLPESVAVICFCHVLCHVTSTNLFIWVTFVCDCPAILLIHLIPILDNQINYFSPAFAILLCLIVNSYLWMFLTILRSHSLCFVTSVQTFSVFDLRLFLTLELASRFGFLCLSLPVCLPVYNPCLFGFHPCLLDLKKKKE